MKAKMKVEMPLEDKEQLLKILDSLHLSVDEVVEQFLRWIVDYPDETVLWLRGRTEEHL